MLLWGRRDSGAAAMSLAFAVFEEKSRLKSLLDHFSTIEDPREPWRVAHPLPEVLLLVVCGTMADCDDYEAIATWGKINLAFLRRYLPYAHGVPGGRWLTLLMNRINPALFSAVFSAWVRKAWPDRPPSHRHRRQEFAPQPRPRPGQGSAASCFGLRHDEPARARPRSRRRQDQRTPGDPGFDRPARRRRRTERRARLHRRHRHQRQDRADDHRQGRRLSARGQGQSAVPLGHELGLTR